MSTEEVLVDVGVVVLMGKDFSIDSMDIRRTSIRVVFIRIKASISEKDSF